MKRFVSYGAMAAALACLGGQAASGQALPPFSPLFATEHTLAESVNWRVEPDGTLVTFGSGRARSRHEAENSFYTFPVRYFEQRSFGFEIHDHIPAGGSTIDIYYSPQFAHWREPECRNAYGNLYRARFNNNQRFDPTPVTPAAPDGTGQRWVCRITRNAHTGSDGVLRAGDFMEAEFQTFLGRYEGDPAVTGQTVYYTDTFRFRVGYPGLYIETDEALDARLRSGGEATAPFVRAGDRVMFDRVIERNGNLLTYRDDQNAIVTHPILDDDPDYDSYIVDSGRAVYTSFMREALNTRWESHNDFLAGRRLFHSSFVDAAHSEPGNPPLDVIAGMARGLLVRESCIGCHANNGRGPAPAPGGPLGAMVMKTGSGQADAHGTPLPHPRFGRALQPFSLNPDLAPEPEVRVDYHLVAGTYPDGSAWQLRRPVYSNVGVIGELLSSSFEDDDWVPGEVQYASVRTPQMLAGLGLLEAVDEETLFARHDPDDADGDGISGRVALVHDPAAPAPRVGRFGWKADKFSLRHFIAAALRDEIGVKTDVYAQPDCGSQQPECIAAAASAPTLAPGDLDLLTAYVQLLGAPSRRPDEIDRPDALAGEAVFAAAGCGACHAPTLRTGMRHPRAELRGQDIHAYTDLLLHDLGPELADHLHPDMQINREWRTAPLWGLGLARAVDGDERLLHDGRARSVEEAILWHGGEAQASRDAFAALPAAQRAQLVAFLRSL